MKALATILITILLLLFVLDIFQCYNADSYAHDNHLKYTISDQSFFAYMHPVDTFEIKDGYIKFVDAQNNKTYIIGGSYYVRFIK